MTIKNKQIFFKRLICICVFFYGMELPLPASAMDFDDIKDCIIETKRDIQDAYKWVAREFEDLFVEDHERAAVNLRRRTNDARTFVKRKFHDAQRAGRRLLNQ